jgi:hypothetical protein
MGGKRPGMDTRSKIVTRAGGLTSGGIDRGQLTVVTGYFDPLLAWHARELSRIAQNTRQSPAKLVVIVLPLEGELLPQMARAILVASLRMVDYVLIAENGDLDSLFAEIKPAEIVRLDDADSRRRIELMDHVRSRQIR